MNKRLILLALFLGATLTACGGSGSSTKPQVENSNVSDNEKDTTTNSETDSDNSTTDNVAIAAKIDPIKSVYTGSTVRLIGTSSIVSANSSINWSIIDKPSHSEAKITNNSRLMSDFVADVAGTYQVQLLIKSGSKESVALASVNVSDKPIEPTNHAPTAVITPFKERVVKNEQVTLSAKDSSDPDGDRLYYKWQVTSANNALDFRLNNPEGQSAIFEGRDYGTFTISLTVHDGKDYSETVTKQIEVYDDRPELKALLDAPETAEVNDFITLNAEASMQYNFATPIFSFDSIPAGSKVKLPQSMAYISFFIPDVAGEYKVRFTLKDRNSDRTASVVKTITVSEKPAQTGKVTTLFYGDRNAPPVLNIVPGPLLNTFTLTEQEFIAEVQDPEGAQVELHWKWLNKPAASQATIVTEANNRASTRFDVAGLYIVQADASDGENTTSRFVAIKVEDPANYAPIITNVEVDGSKIKGNRLTLKANAYDKEANPITFTWLVIMPNGTIAPIGTETSNTATLPLTAAGTYQVLVYASDNIAPYSGHKRITFVVQ
ncbi:PKD domain-containing protein [Pseudoalteromonas piscicida]|uniref:PKD domain-containing protein n=1 Tax=Pseudoalteromonas piscicida TaxID=43662 RepID=UPI0030AF2972